MPRERMQKQTLVALPFNRYKLIVLVRQAESEGVLGSTFARSDLIGSNRRISRIAAMGLRRSRSRSSNSEGFIAWACKFFFASAVCMILFSTLRNTKGTH